MRILKCVSSTNVNSRERKRDYSYSIISVLFFPFFMNILYTMIFHTLFKIVNISKYISFVFTKNLFHKLVIIFHIPHKNISFE